MVTPIVVPQSSTASDGKQVTDFLPPHGLWTAGSMETDFSSGLLNSRIAGIIRQVEVGESAGEPENIVEVNRTWEVDVRWDLKGKAVPLICGEWRVKLFLESLGADELDREARYPVGIPLDQRSDSYHAQFLISANALQVEEDEGTPFQLVASVILMGKKGDRFVPSPIIGYVTFPVAQFFREYIDVDLTTADEKAIAS